MNSESKNWLEEELEGKPSGFFVGRVEGRLEGKVEIARRLLAKGEMSIPEIAEVTGLSERVVELSDWYRDSDICYTDE